VYRTDGIAGDGSVPVGRTQYPEVLRILRDHLLRQAAYEVRNWGGYDPAIGAMKVADAERLASILRVLLPDDEMGPDLEVLPGGLAEADGKPIERLP
jgi:hypothetical protein